MPSTSSIRDGPFAIDLQLNGTARRGSAGEEGIHDTLIHYCPRQPGIRRFGEGKSFILSTSPISLGGGHRGRHDPVQNGSEADVGRQNASSSTQNGYLRACRESFRPPTSGHRPASPVQKGGRQKLFWTRVVSRWDRRLVCESGFSQVFLPSWWA